MARPSAEPAGPAAAPAEIPSPERPAWQRIRGGLQVFLLLSLIGSLLAFWWKRPAGLGELFAMVNWWLLLLTIPLVGVDHVLGGLRYRVLFNGRILPRISLWNCMRSNWANLFMGMVTPCQTGGGPAQIYLLWRCGASVADGMLASLVNFAATLVFFLVGSIAALTFIPDDLFDPRLTSLVRAGFMFLAALILLVFGLLLRPTFFLGLFRRLAGLIPARLVRVRRGCDRLLDRLAGEVENFRAALGRLWHGQRSLLPVIFLLTIWLFMNKYLIGYVIASAFESGVPFTVFIGLQICQLFLIYFAPTPGASGLAELSSVWMLATLLAEGTLVVYTMLWRLTTTVVGAIIGAGVLFDDLRRWSRSKKGGRGEVSPPAAG